MLYCNYQSTQSGHPSAAGKISTGESWGGNRQSTNTIRGFIHVWFEGYRKWRLAPLYIAPTFSGKDLLILYHYHMK